MYEWCNFSCSVTVACQLSEQENDQAMADDHRPLFQDPEHGDGQAKASAGGPATTSAADEAPLRLCRHCSAQARTNGTTCPICGHSYLRGWKGMRRRTRVVLVALPLLLLLGGGVTGGVLKYQHDQDVKEQRAEAERQANAERRERERDERERREREDAAAAIDRIERETRRSAETDMRRSIRKDANEKIAEGLLDGPDVRRVSCNPIAGGSDSLEEPTARYECLAVNETDYDEGTDRGYRYTATMNFEDGSYTWRLGGE
jgi:hypothetical protein